MSHSNLERSLRQEKEEAPLTEREQERSLFRQYMNLQHYISLNEKRLYMVSKMDYLRDSREAESKIDFHMFKQAKRHTPDPLALRTEMRQFYTSLRENSPMQLGRMREPAQRPPSPCFQTAPKKAIRIKIPSPQPIISRNALAGAKTDNHIEAMLKEPASPLLTTRSKWEQATSKIELFSVSQTRKQEMMRRFLKQ